MLICGAKQLKSLVLEALHHIAESNRQPKERQGSRLSGDRSKWEWV